MSPAATNRLLAFFGGWLGGASVSLGLLIRYARISNLRSKEHRS